MVRLAMIQFESSSCFRTKSLEEMLGKKSGSSFCICRKRSGRAEECSGPWMAKTEQINESDYEREKYNAAMTGRMG